jgi:hypothetical protein
MPYRYLPQYFTGIDPRSQTEDVGDDPVRAGTLAVANLKRVVPKLVEWTTRPGEDYSDLGELYGEALGMWSQYMGHVVSVVGGVHVESKTADQAGAVYRPVPRARQEAALRFLGEQVIRTPEWLAPDAIVSRLGPAPLAARQSAILAQLLDTRRLARLADSQTMGASTYPVAGYLEDLRGIVWGGSAQDANRRSLQRVYLERLGAMVDPPAPTPGAGGPGGGGVPSPLLATPNVQRSDLPALARSQLRAIRTDAQRNAGSSSGVVRAHWQDVTARVDEILDPR